MENTLIRLNVIDREGKKPNIYYIILAKTTKRKVQFFFAQRKYDQVQSKTNL